MMYTSASTPYDSWSFPQQSVLEPMADQHMAALVYSTWPTTTLASPQYPNQQAFPNAPYQCSPPLTPLSHPYKYDALRTVTPYVEAASGMPCRRTSQQSSENPTRSRPLRSESLAVHSVGSNPNTNSKTIIYNETVNSKDRVSFETEVDELLKVIQQKEEEVIKSSVFTHAESANTGSISGTQSPGSSCQPLTPGQMGPTNKKKWVCDGPKCNKRFDCKTHLDTHRRTHTGDKPYVCTEQNCGLTFSQKSNLKTHMRRHTGVKPYACSTCGKLFGSRCDVRSHEKTHTGLKPFVCRLNNCNERFSQLGSMKIHQNKFHKETLQGLTSLFVKFSLKSEVPEEYQELFEYFSVHYKNSNKGIKGRGKGRWVAPKGGL
ncbi:DNA-binding transcription factor [Purpureocillium takamizusanense]|uniref:DNA-binding transcription factor n=1 Tax=Purpureocillium takamizusanense TaxID=2060973 RepID=A0A9Q8QAH5_9HYPO|nr:DNA-binding transcription factor [Purpureocillium takamizusanense]UNI15361.1 DNA-binding transcription factor [Purpureocillium takamizusanense]